MPSRAAPPVFASRHLVATLVMGLALSACGQATPPNAGAIITFAFEGDPADTLRAFVTRPEAISTAEQVLSGTLPRMMPIGPIRRGPGLDPRYPFHFIPDSLRLTSVAIELCDALPMRTSAEVDAFIKGATGSDAASSATWCPWSGYPIKLVRQ